VYCLVLPVPPNVLLKAGNGSLTIKEDLRIGMYLFFGSHALLTLALCSVVSSQSSFNSTGCKELASAYPSPVLVPLSSGFSAESTGELLPHDVPRANQNICQPTKTGHKHVSSYQRVCSNRLLRQCLPVHCEYLKRPKHLSQ
jgi:hypothetical protein